MRQIKIGQWPAKSPAEAAGDWDNLRKQREGGVDPAMAKKQARAVVAASKPKGYTIRNAVDDYLAGHVDQHRKDKGAAEVRRIFDK